ncbi:TonB-dependent receptor [Limibacter armeniacum]|uniref:SusC/RagA family TonB-linked outer membrane protein n=1 Tax=Limibacter armeniacum TaxID=466084 RepID=UPI002FE635EA
MKHKDKIDFGEYRFSFSRSHFYLLIFLFVVSTTTVFGQTGGMIKGVVVSEMDGSPLPGANVLIKGTVTGTLTDFDGKFAIQAKEGETLVVSFVGHVSQEVLLTGQSQVKVALSEDAAELEEIVVVGYGVQKKKLLTGATGQVKGETISKLSTANPLDAMQGQTPGVNITATSGQPGESMKVNIRGVGTIGNSQPLYIVDGVQTGDISYLNAADIESFDVLKDAASAAIYGSQAANGVVLITTKKGKEGSMNVTFDTYYGVQQPAGKVDLLNGKEYAVIMNEAAINSGKAPIFTSEQIASMGEGTDWLDQMIYNNAVTENYVLGLNGGNQTSVYSMSLSYTGQEGIMGGPEVSDYERYSLRINTDHKVLGDIVKIGQNLTFSHSTRRGVSVGDQYNNSLRGAFNTSPFLPVYDDNGNYMSNLAGVMYQGEEWSPWFPGESNPFASMMLNNQGKNTEAKLLGNVFVEVNPLDGLKFTSRIGFDYYYTSSRYYKPEYELSIYDRRINNSVSQALGQGLAWTWDNFAQYDMRFGKSDLSLMAGVTAYENTGQSLSITNTDMIFNDYDHAWINNTTNQDYAQLTYDGSPNDPENRLSYYGRLNYTYNEKYLFNTTFRADGSSRFANVNQWGYFPSVSAGWIVSAEDFMSFTEPFMDFFKLRASWGQVGNQSIEAWQFLAPISIGNSNYYFGSEDFNASGNAIGAYPSRLGNPDVRWETSEQTNIGFDADFLKGKLSTTFDWYNKTTKDWLLERPGYATDGADAPVFNGGNVINKGIEIGLNWSDQVGELKYSIGANITKNKNKVTDVPTDDGIVPGLENVLYDNAGQFYRRAQTGLPIGYFWGLQTDGIFQNEAEVASYTGPEGSLIQPNAQPGDLRYIDVNNDGVIDDNDKVNLGDPNPDYTFSFTLSAEYKGFDFSVLAYGVAGNQIVQSYRNHANGYSNYTTEILDRWHGEGTSNTIPRVTQTNVNYVQFSDIFVKDGDFLRINNITLGYDFKHLVSNGFFKRLRLYATVQNPFVFTNYNGMDPEVGYGLQGGSSGVDLGFYPRPKTYLVGANINF